MPDDRTDVKSSEETKAEQKQADPRPRIPSMVSFAAGLWMILGSLTGHMGPPWPCAVAGAIAIGSATMMYKKPHQGRVWGMVVITVSVGVLFLGSGGIIPGLIGIAGGAFGIAWSSPPDDNASE